MIRPPLCDRGPDGWWCSRDADHDGPCALHEVGDPRPRRTVTVPAYTVGLAVITCVAMCLLTLWAGVTISNRNAARLLAKYEADKVAAAEQSRGLYCELFRSQMNAFDGAESDVGKASYKAWLAVYRLVHCQPAK